MGFNLMVEKPKNDEEQISKCKDNLTVVSEPSTLYISVFLKTGAIQALSTLD